MKRLPTFGFSKLLFGSTLVLLVVPQVWAAETSMEQHAQREEIESDKAELVASRDRASLDQSAEILAEDLEAEVAEDLTIDRLEASSVDELAQSVPPLPVQDRQRLQQRQQAQPGRSNQPAASSQPFQVQPTAQNQQGQDVLVPNPAVTIDGAPSQPAGTARPISPAPPLLPRAIAPPVGDIAVSNINANPGSIDLGSAERIPRLVLRDAPVREVLSLLARAAGMNIAYIDELPASLTSGTRNVTRPNQEESEPTVSLDIENESVQDVFNYVLRITGMEANRVGRTVFVGPRLPDDARNLVARTYRLNQVPVTTAANYLSAQGAITQLPIERISIESVGEPGFRRLIERREPDIIPLGAEEGNGPLLLRGLSIVTDERLNSITLVGHPRKVQMATTFLQQLDARRRQVALNVKIIDVSLEGNENTSASFSFGTDNTFFVQQDGTAVFNYGRSRPPTATEATGSVLSPTIIGAPTQGATTPFLDAQPGAPFGRTDPQPFGSPVLNDGTIQVGTDPNFGGLQRGIAVRPPFGTEDNPLVPGVTQVQQGQITYGLPELFRFPRQFLAQLQSQIISRNAKILTDPTLIVQEGQTASVALVEEVIGNQTTTFTETAGVVRETTNITKEDVGLTLEVAVDRIDDNGFVSLRVVPNVSAPVAQVATNNGGFITLIQERQVNSGLIRLRDGQTLILTGIIQDQDRTEVRKVPILGDIPILGALFRSTTRTNDRSEVVVLLTPNILDDSERSTFGYGYVPGEETRQMLQRTGTFNPNQR